MSDLGQAADGDVTPDDGDGGDVTPDDGGVTPDEGTAPDGATSTAGGTPGAGTDLRAAEHGAAEPGGTENDDPEPLGLGVTPTGNDDVDARLRRLRDTDHLAVSGHQGVYENVHRGLRDMLAALDRPRS